MKLNPKLDAQELSARFKRDSRISIAHILRDEDARALRKAIEQEPHRNMVFYANGRHFDIDGAGWRALGVEKKRTTEQIINAEAQKGFSYHYENLPIYDRWRQKSAMGSLLCEAVEFLNSEDFLSLMRRVTGFDDIAFADAQATLYGPGHFLTLHDDAVEGKNRRAAYVLNLTGDWSNDWGGYLNFFDSEGNIEAAYKPAFNALNVFSVPAAHSVGYVAPFAGALRCSITGWLRAGKDVDVGAS
ncbi:2OG-Fe(II) oxygenase [Hyphococcus sp.]|uniref:2OG-Fe(II) oxygenase n=1 Tax=Hyphococcus sp. TaxID=2038636 RepID=UPI0020800476|nr:MAG: proline hydroxylase [Marinicaulis sp.]